MQTKLDQVLASQSSSPCVASSLDEIRAAERSWQVRSILVDIEMVSNAIRIAELAIDKQAQTLLMPVSARRQLNDLPDELWTKISIEFYKDGPDAVFKALVE